MVSAKPKQPNIVFIIADDHRHDAIRAHGDSTVQTPALDSLIAEGTTFRGMHIMGGLSPAVCMPSRASVHTGVNVFRAGGQQVIDPELALMPETLKQNGYYTYMVGKWHNDKRSFARSFNGGEKLFFGGMSDHYHVPTYAFDPSGEYPKGKESYENRHSADLFGDAAVHFLQSYERDEPFFLYAAFTSPHDPRTAPEDFAKLYESAGIPLPGNFMSEHPFDNGELRIRDELLAEFPRTVEEVRTHIADYYAMISHLDSQVGRLVQTLKDRGLWENTIVVYTADHGLSVGRHGLLGKQNMYDHSVRIPFIVSGGGLPQGRRVDKLTYQIDIFPTICELIGVEVPSTVEGRSMGSLLTGVEEQGRECVYSVYMDVQRMVKDTRWKLIRYYSTERNGQGSDRVQLFDLANDPLELRDLASDERYDEPRTRLAGELREWQKKVGDPLSGKPVLP